MQLDSTFSVTAPIDEVWATLMDFERVAGCVPGAQILNRLSDDAYQVGSAASQRTSSLRRLMKAARVLPNASWHMRQ